MMVKVFYNGYPYSKPNTWLGGRLFLEGLCEIENDEDGLYYADLFRLKYEVINQEPKKAAKPKTKKVKSND